MIFVFGSNLRGIHGAGAAKYALFHEHAVYGQGIGPQGNCYAIPTKGWVMDILPLWQIAEYIADFIAYARKYPELEFKVTQIGCGLAGYKASEIAPLFRDAPMNCLFDEAWSWCLPEHKKWGTM